eukprot:ANDGO_00792.mRNA.1 hypothetical protein
MVWTMQRIWWARHVSSLHAQVQNQRTLWMTIGLDVNTKSTGCVVLLHQNPAAMSTERIAAFHPVLCVRNIPSSMPKKKGSKESCPIPAPSDKRDTRSVLRVVHASILDTSDAVSLPEKAFAMKNQLCEIRKTLELSIGPDVRYSVALEDFLFNFAGGRTNRRVLTGLAQMNALSQFVCAETFLSHRFENQQAIHKMRTTSSTHGNGDVDVDGDGDGEANRHEVGECFEQITLVNAVTARSFLRQFSLSSALEPPSANGENARSVMFAKGSSSTAMLNKQQVFDQLADLVPKNVYEWKLTPRSKQLHASNFDITDAFLIALYAAHHLLPPSPLSPLPKAC